MIPNLRQTLDNPLNALREFDRVVNRVWDNVEETVGTAGFPVDIVEHDDQLVVTADLPGYAKDQIDVNVEEGVLTIDAQRDKPEPAADAKTYVHERRTHRAARRFTLPTAYDTNNVQAKLVDGVLTLTLSKREESKPRKVDIQ